MTRGIESNDGDDRKAAQTKAGAALWDCAVNAGGIHPVYWMGTAAVATAGLAYAAYCGLGATTDGAYMIFRILIGDPDNPHGRYIYYAIGKLVEAFAFSLPSTWHVANWTTVAWGSVFAAIFGALVWISLWLVRRSGPAMLCVALAHLVATLPGQTQMFSAAAFSARVAGTLLLATMLSKYATASCGFVALAVLILPGIHPIAGIALVGYAGCLAFRSWRERRLSLLVPASLSIVAAALLLARLASGGEGNYESSELKWSMLMTHVRSSLQSETWSILGLAYGLGLLLVWRVLVPSARFPGRYLAPIVLAVSLAIAVLGVVWASDMTHWIHAIDYRRVAFVTIFPLFVIAAVLALFSSGETVAEKPRHSWVAASLVVFAVGNAAALFVQANEWAGLRVRLKDAVTARTGVIDAQRELDWAYMSPLRNWSLPFHMILLQAPVPVAIGDYTGIERHGEKLRVGSGHDIALSPRKQGYLDFAELERNLRTTDAAPLWLGGAHRSESLNGVRFRWIRASASARFVVGNAGLYRISFSVATPFERKPRTLRIFLDEQNVIEPQIEASQPDKGQLVQFTQRLHAGPHVIGFVTSGGEVRFGQETRDVALAVADPFLVEYLEP